mmetsp:Transcript_6831/g.15606  ORF Transcript_6831/g.15606 Transcript_6831/m.15606 type:complete len:224 (-) Transcript_6831:2573-3244(-)
MQTANAECPVPEGCRASARRGMHATMTCTTVTRGIFPRLHRHRLLCPLPVPPSSKTRRRNIRRICQLNPRPLWAPARTLPITGFAELAWTTQTRSAEFTARPRRNALLARYVISELNATRELTRQRLRPREDQLHPRRHCRLRRSHQQVHLPIRPVLRSNHPSRYQPRVRRLRQQSDRRMHLCLRSKQASTAAKIGMMLLKTAKRNARPENPRSAPSMRNVFL